MKQRFLPIGLKVAGEQCLVVGGGEIGTRKAENLLRAGARVKVVAPAVTAALVELAEREQVAWLEETFRNEHLEGVFLAVAATDDREENTEITRRARESGVLICDASSSSDSQVIFGALHEDDGVTVAVFTDGRDPGQARSLRDRISGFLSGGDS
ncbi:bifunctional precorrin-2 dehydrogenase/sirohydrochlorin ferrochelatase [Gemmatimonadota bacterium]